MSSITYDMSSIRNDSKPNDEHYENVQMYNDDAEKAGLSPPDETRLERKVKLKMDMFVLPLTLIVYLLASMVRVSY